MELPTSVRRHLSRQLAGIDLDDAFAQMMRKVTPATPIAGPGRHADFLVDALIGHEPVGIERAALRRLPHRAARLGEMAAVVERHWSRKGWNSAK